jgi:hypothetical protein
MYRLDKFYLAVTILSTPLPAVVRLSDLLVLLDVRDHDPACAYEKPFKALIRKSRLPTPEEAAVELKSCCPELELGWTPPGSLSGSVTLVYVSNSSFSPVVSEMTWMDTSDELLGRE